MRRADGGGGFVANDSTIGHLFGDGGRDSATADGTDVLTSIESST